MTVFTCFIALPAWLMFVFAPAIFGEQIAKLRKAYDAEMRR